jgi:hypothetical protein
MYSFVIIHWGNILLLLQHCHNEDAKGYCMYETLMLHVICKNNDTQILLLVLLCIVIIARITHSNAILVII